MKNLLYILSGLAIVSGIIAFLIAVSMGLARIFHTDILAGFCATGIVLFAAGSLTQKYLDKRDRP